MRRSAALRLLPNQTYVDYLENGISPGTYTFLRPSLNSLQKFDLISCTTTRYALLTLKNKIFYQWYLWKDSALG